MGQCFGKRIITASFGGVSATSRDVQCKSNGACLNFDAWAAAIKLDIQFLDALGTAVYDVRLPYGPKGRPSFPQLYFANSTIRPSGADTVFQNFCIKPQGPFFAWDPNRDFLIFPMPGAQIDSRISIRVPSELIRRITSVKGGILSDTR